MLKKYEIVNFYQKKWGYHWKKCNLAENFEFIIF